MENIIIKQLEISHPDYQQVYELREEILRKPIGLSLKDEDLSKDSEDIILVAHQHEVIIGCVMLKHTEDAGIFKLRQMAIAAARQGKGIGRMLVKAAEKLLAEKEVRKIVLHARVTAEDFYAGLGYKKTSGIFTEVGIPHIIMEKSL
jgi:predicted GNAT family N-acyltransferase